MVKQRYLSGLCQPEHEDDKFNQWNLDSEIDGSVIASDCSEYIDDEDE